MTVYAHNQRVRYCGNNEYEIYDDYGGSYINENEFKRLLVAVRKNTPGWLDV